MTKPTDKVMKEWKEIRKLGPDDQTMGQFYDKIEAFLIKSLSQATAEARGEAVKILKELQYQNSLILDGVVIKNAQNGGYVLNDHQRRMDDLFETKLAHLTKLSKEK